jgi:hypothetical protein
MNDEDAEFAEWIAEREMCTSCGGEAVHILWGLATSEMGALEEQGSLVLGGCLVDDDSPDWQCMSCGHQWANEIDYATMDSDTLFLRAISGDKGAVDFLNAG